MTKLLATLKTSIAMVLGMLLVFSFAITNTSISASAYAQNWQKGISFQSRGNEDFASDTFKQSVLNASTLGVNHISLVATYYQYGKHEVNIYEGWNTPTENALREATAYAKSLGMTVSYKLFMETNDGWRAYIQPYNKYEWFQNYTALAVNLGRIAESAGAEMIVLGTEMVGIASAAQDPANTGYWYDLIDQVRGVYSGKLTYGGNWGGAFDEKNNIEFWDALDYIGVSAYYEPGRAGAYDVESLQNFWAGIDYNDLRPLSERWGKDIIFTEVGYRSVDQALDRPWEYGSWGNYNPGIQETAYEGLLSYFANVPYLYGMHMWDWNSDPNYGGEGNLDYTPWNKPAGEVLRAYYNGTGTPAAQINPPEVTTPEEEEEVEEVVESEPTNTNLVFETSVDSLPDPVILGAAAELHANVSNISRSRLENGIVNLEVYEDGNKIYQSYQDNITISAGDTVKLKYNWTPERVGDYQIKVGIFSGDWSNLYTWFNEVRTVEVVEAGTGQGGEPDIIIDEMPSPIQVDPNPVNPIIDEDDTDEMIEGEEMIEVWWPGEGLTVNGVQPFKAILTNSELNDYYMFWQVGGDAYNWMGNADEEFPHKQSLVDLSNWNWNTNGTYEITFIAQNLQGQDTHKKTVEINVR